MALSKSLAEKAAFPSALSYATVSLPSHHAMPCHALLAIGRVRRGEGNTLSEDMLLTVMIFPRD